MNLPINKIIHGDSLEVLKTLPSDSVDCVITSPPYWSLRSYLKKDDPLKEKEIGSEPTFKEFLDKMMLVFAEVKRVLKPSGSFWLNFGDSYISQPPGNKTNIGLNKGDGLYGRLINRNGIGEGNSKVLAKKRFDEKNYGGLGQKRQNTMVQGRSRNDGEFQEKSLLMQPARIAIKMCDEQDWILRADINWVKQILIWKRDSKYTMGSVMPSSVKDRVNMAGEHLFHFVKSKKYYYDIDAVRIPSQSLESWREAVDRKAQGNSKFLDDYGQGKQQVQRKIEQKFNYRVRDAVKKEGQPQFKASEEEIRKYKKSPPNKGLVVTSKEDPLAGMADHRTADGWIPNTFENPNGKNIPNNWLIQSEPSKEHHFAKFPSMLCEIPIIATTPENGVVMDIFAGSGTACLVAKKLGRSYIGIELNSEYVALAENKLSATPVTLFAQPMKHEMSAL